MSETTVHLYHLDGPTICPYRETTLAGTWECVDWAHHDGRHHLVRLDRREHVEEPPC